LQICREQFAVPSSRELAECKNVHGKNLREGIPMIKWILILLIIAAVASLLGFNSLAGAAATGARILIGIVLILFLLVLFGLVVVA
jgi:uncharacterized membrane protein YtjA (UPF0391 family)